MTLRSGFGKFGIQAGGIEKVLLKNYANLVALIDVADSNSYSGSGTSLVNLAASPADGSSASAYNFTLGSDFTFNGSAGSLARTTYFNGDGGNGDANARITLTGSNTTFIKNFHKDNANLSIIMLFRNGSSQSNHGHLISTGTISLNAGLGFYFAGTTGDLQYQITRAYSGSGPTTALSGTDTVVDTAISTSAYAFAAVSVNEAAGAGGSFHYLNGSYNQTDGTNTFNGTYDTPSTGDPHYKLAMWNGGSSSTYHWPMVNDAHFIGMLLFNTALSKKTMDNIYKAIKTRLTTTNATLIADALVEV